MKCSRRQPLQHCVSYDRESTGIIVNCMFSSGIIDSIVLLYYLWHYETVLIGVGTGVGKGGQSLGWPVLRNIFTVLPTPQIL